MIYDKKFKPKVEKGEVDKVEFGGVIDRLTETGTIELVRTVEVKSQISGKIKKLLIEEGDYVTENQVLAIIEPDPNQALTLNAKRAAVDRAKIQYSEQKKDLERQQELFKKNLISKQDLDKTENLSQLAVNTYEQSLLELRILEQQMADVSSGSKPTKNLNPGTTTKLDDYRIVSPISGIVISRDIEIGEMIVSGISAYTVGTKLFQIGDPSEMIVKSSISEVDVGKLRIGQDVQIVTDSYPDSLYRGKVKHVAPEGKIKPGTTIVTFETEIEIIDPDERLRQGMSCDLNIIFNKREKVLALPIEAIYEVMIKDIEGEETTQVDSVVAYQWLDGKYKEIRIETGLQSSSRAEIVSGLREGDEVSLEAGKKYKEFHKKREELK